MRVSIYQIFEINRILRLSYKYKSFLSKVVNFFCKNYYTTILTIRYCAFGVFYFRFFFQCRFCLALGQAYSLASFGLCVGWCGLAMCEAVERGLYVLKFLSLRYFLIVKMFLKFYKQSADVCNVSQNFFCIFQ